MATKKPAPKNMPVVPARPTPGTGGTSSRPGTNGRGTKTKR